MRIFCVAVIGLVMGACSTASAFAQDNSDYPLQWRAANDDPGAVLIPPPAQPLLKAEKKFAKGEVTAVIARGGPTGVYIWTHLHGVHGDRGGTTDYSVGLILSDSATNFPILTIHAYQMTVEGVIDKPDRHRHAFGFAPVKDRQTADNIQSAFEAGTLKLVIVASRQNRGVTKFVEEDLKPIAQHLAMSYLSGGKMDLGQLSQLIDAFAK